MMLGVMMMMMMMFGGNYPIPLFRNKLFETG